MVDEGLVVQGLSKKFGSLIAVDNLSLHVPRGAMIGFLGPNGSGKTTTMRAILGMVKPDRGTITWDGHLIDDNRLSRIGYMPQDRGVYPKMRVREQVIYFGRLAGLTKERAASQADYWLERLTLTDRADALVQELSGGNQQRVQLAVSLVHDPDLLVLDEPFAGLDPVAAETMRAIIADRAEHGASVLFSSHQLDLVEDLCSDVVVIAAGREVASGSITQLRSASPIRRLRVRWVDSVSGWTPLEGALQHLDEHSAVVDLPASADLAASVSYALHAGPVSEISVEPPTLDEIFADLIGGAA